MSNRCSSHCRSTVYCSWSKFFSLEDLSNRKSQKLSPWKKEVHLFTLISLTSMSYKFLILGSVCNRGLPTESRETDRKSQKVVPLGKQEINLVTLIFLSSMSYFLSWALCNKELPCKSRETDRKSQKLSPLEKRRYNHTPSDVFLVCILSSMHHKFPTSGSFRAACCRKLTFFFTWLDLSSIKKNQNFSN